MASAFLVLVSVASVFTKDDAPLALENRYAEPWPTWQFFRETSFDLTRRQFERAFSDHLGLRSILLTVEHSVLLGAFHESPTDEVLLGKDGYLFLAEEERIALPSLARLPGASPEAIATAITNRADRLAAVGVQYYLFIAPDKATVYADKIPSSHLRPGPSRLAQVMSSLPSSVRAHVIDPTAALESARTSFDTYYRTDTHWTPAGAQLVANEIARAIPELGTQGMPLLLPPPRVVAARGQIALMIGMPSWFEEPFFHDPTATRPESFPNCKFLTQFRDDLGRVRRFSSHCVGAADGRLLLYRDSFFSPLLGTVASRFTETEAIWDPNDTALTAVTSFKPTIVIEEIVERNLDRLVGQASEEGASQ